ncbi:nitrogenase component 1 [Methanocalculus sp.]|uniref:nitrogenase component 1 n=1 Tax=Methanocalculus sp. TaxID=2004547 RepID=UPI0027175411|nr:nitrogenase component 1 [Methanocalculus sp.]MDO8840831.1 nitrogenase component 1 [Methanocalculus sp.]
MHGGGLFPVPECTNPVWPCALTGAAAFLAGFRGLSVVIHGSSGCYYYPRSLIKAPLFGSFIMQDEVIFGTGDRLRSVISDVSKDSERVAVVTSCVPALMGEDLASELDGFSALLIDSPGFLGGAEAGYRIASEVLLREATVTTEGVNIGGICLLDPFHRGNLHESRRLLAMAGIPVGAVISYDRLDALSRLAPVTVYANPDYTASGYEGGTLLGFSAIKKTFSSLSGDPSSVLAECDWAEEMVIAVCEKYLRRNDPPNAAICSQAGYAGFFADLLVRYLGSDTPLILRRNETDLPAVTDYDQIADALHGDSYNLIIGSSYEAQMKPDAGFVGVTPPIRGRIVIGSRPLAGIEGVITAVEMILNALMDKKKRV